MGRKQEADPEGHGQMMLYMPKKKYDEVKRLAEDRDTWRKMMH